MAQHYSDVRRAAEPTALPDVETFRVSRGDEPQFDEFSNRLRCGWYWWSCFPGCIPDGGPNGPFRSEAAALRDAREGRDLDSDDDGDGA
ncbi:MAG: hypothetical protein FJX72_03015 [Armatimonadetes bacterium]|nr:hypothetical protein [Armatimonadota bacterium]